ncbi:AbfB domain-containing protein [Micromonospora palythoicola]|uniref:AbfB domain-containing protein n=1 Tax=Micromonospora palythoicola TaxID=3120507 RepID=UPI002FCE5D60
MSQHGNGRSPLRIGGWLSGTVTPGSGASSTRHHPGAPADPGRAVGDHPGTGKPASEHRHHDETPSAATGRRDESAGRAAPRRTQLLGGAALVVVTAVVGVMALRDATPQEPIRSEFVAGMPRPDGAATDAADDGPPGTDGTGSDAQNGGAASPEPSTDPVVRPRLNPRADGSDADDAGSTGPGRPPATPAKNPPPAPSTPAPPAEPALVPGARIGLEAAGSPGHRVRHANFQARVDPVDAASSAGTRADAAFTVRPGLAGAGCVSFESVNFPGHYLRHSGFRVFLHRADGSALFRADATFCPVTGIGGRHTSLRSHNFPDRYLSHHPHQQLRISPIGGGAGPSTASFLIRPAL